MLDTDAMNTRTLAKKIAKDIFEAGSGPEPVGRIQFMGGKYPDNEKPQGGFCFDALVGCIEKSLHRYDTD